MTMLSAYIRRQEQRPVPVQGLRQLSQGRLQQPVMPGLGPHAAGGDPGARSPSAGGWRAPPSWWGATDPRCRHHALLGRPGLEQSKGVTSSANQIGQLPGRLAVSAADMKRAVTRSPERQRSTGRRVFTWFSYKEALKCGERRPWKEHASHSGCLLLKYRVAGLQPCSEGYFRSWLLCCRGRCQRSPGLDGLTLGFWRWEEGVPQALRQGGAFPVKRGP